MPGPSDGRQGRLYERGKARVSESSSSVEASGDANQVTNLNRELYASLVRGQSQEGAAAMSVGSSTGSSSSNSSVESNLHVLPTNQETEPRMIRKEIDELFEYAVLAKLLDPYLRSRPMNENAEKKFCQCLGIVQTLKEQFESGKVNNSEFDGARFGHEQQIKALQAEIIAHQDNYWDDWQNTGRRQSTENSRRSTENSQASENASSDNGNTGDGQFLVTDETKDLDTANGNK